MPQLCLGFEHVCLKPLLQEKCVCCSSQRICYGFNIQRKFNLTAGYAPWKSKVNGECSDQLSIENWFVSPRQGSGSFIIHMVELSHKESFAVSHSSEAAPSHERAAVYVESSLSSSCHTASISLLEGWISNVQVTTAMAFSYLDFLLSA